MRQAQPLLKMCQAAMPAQPREADLIEESLWGVIDLTAFTSMSKAMKLLKWFCTIHSFYAI